MRIMKLTEIDNPLDLEKNETIVDLIDATMRNMPPQAIPRGWDKHRLYSKLYRCLEKARETKKLQMEEDVYRVLHDAIDKHILAEYARRKEFDAPLAEFMSLKPVEVEEVNAKKQTKQTEGN